MIFTDKQELFSFGIDYHLSPIPLNDTDSE